MRAGGSGGGSSWGPVVAAAQCSFLGVCVCGTGCVVAAVGTCGYLCVWRQGCLVVGRGVSAVYGQKSWRNIAGVFLEDWRASTASPSTFPSPPVYCRPHTLQYRLGKEAWKRGYLETKKGRIR